MVAIPQEHSTHISMRFKLHGVCSSSQIRTRFIHTDYFHLQCGSDRSTTRPFISYSQVGPCLASYFSRSLCLNTRPAPPPFHANSKTVSGLQLCLINLSVEPLAWTEPFDLVCTSFTPHTHKLFRTDEVSQKTIFCGQSTEVHISLEWR